MKNMILGLLLLSSTSFADKIEAHEQYMFLTNKNYSCFVYGREEWSKFPWEKDFFFKDKPHMLIRHNDKGVLIAQPSNYCEESQGKRVQFCSFYSIRTISFDDWYFPMGAKFTKCPKGFDKKFIKAFIKKEYSDEFELDDKE